MTSARKARADYKGPQWVAGKVMAERLRKAASDAGVVVSGVLFQDGLVSCTLHVSGQQLSVRFPRNTSKPVMRDQLGAIAAGTRAMFGRRSNTVSAPPPFYDPAWSQQ